MRSNKIKTKSKNEKDAMILASINVMSKKMIWYKISAFVSFYF